MAWDVGRIVPDSTPGSFIWRVEDFFSHPQDDSGYSITSPYFSALGANWKLRVRSSVHFDGASRTRLELVKFWDCDLVLKIGRFQFGILGRGGAKLVSYSRKVKIMETLPLQESIDLPENWRQDREEFAPGGVLSVFCRLQEIEATPENDSGTRTGDIGQVPQECGEGATKSCSSPGAHKVVENLKGLLSSEEGCDVTLKVQNQDFKAHKALLVARSSVFRAMFCHEMSEKLGNEVLITDCDPDAFRIFLSHVYTGDAEGLSVSNAFDVFSVADKYDATELKIQCKECFASNITLENVCDVVAFSLLHSDSVLLEMASEFFTKHFRQIILTNQWQCFLRDHTTAANELIIRASKCYVPLE